MQSDGDEISFVLDQHAELDFYSASSLKQQSVDRHVAPLGHIIMIPSQPSLCSYSVMLHAYKLWLTITHSPIHSYDHDSHHRYK
jgi:hypothetical protein